MVSSFCCRVHPVPSAAWTTPVPSAVMSTQRPLQPGQHLDSGGSLLSLACGLSAPGTMRSEVSVVLPAPEAQSQLCPPSAQGDGAAQGSALSSSAWSSTALGQRRLSSPTATSPNLSLAAPSPPTCTLLAPSSCAQVPQAVGPWRAVGLCPRSPAVSA